MGLNNIWPYILIITINKMGQSTSGLVTIPSVTITPIIIGINEIKQNEINQIK